MTTTPRTLTDWERLMSQKSAVERELTASRAECERLREALKKIVRHNTAGMSDQMQDDVRDARMLVSP